VSEGLDRELALAADLAVRAGAELLRYFRTNVAVERKAGNEPVSEADRCSERVILAGLRHEFPNDGILSEEQPDQVSWVAAKRAWLVDPLDGTRDFLDGSEGFSVMIGLLELGQPILGVVYQPAEDLIYRAARGCPATATRRGIEALLEPTAVADPGQARLVASRSHRSGKIDQVKTELGISDELNIGSVGLKIGLVARGARDLYLNPDGFCKLWDICAPSAILEQAGGRISDLKGSPLSYHPDRIRVAGGIVASNGPCHDAVIRGLAPLFP
jgi:3'(2'), 5'-bisphosphate nucleotidase